MKRLARIAAVVALAGIAAGPSQAGWFWKTTERSDKYNQLHNEEAVALDPARLVQFLEQAAQRADGLPEREGFALLRRSTEELLDKSQFRLPLGVETSLRGVIFGGRESNTHVDGHKIMVQGLAAVAAAAEPLSGEADQFFPAMMGVARASAAGVSDANGYSALRGFLSSTRIYPELVPTGVLLLTLEAARKASDRPCTDAEGLIVLNAALTAMEGAGATQDRGVYLDAALGGLEGIDAHGQYRVLKHYAKKLVKSSYLIDGFDRVTLETAIKTATWADTDAAAVQVLQEALESLR